MGWTEMQLVSFYDNEPLTQHLSAAALFSSSHVPVVDHIHGPFCCVRSL